MAEVDNNPLLQGVKGRLGKTMVLKSARGKFIMANRPKKTTKEPNPSQVAFRQRFLEAVYYAKGQIADPASEALYATGITQKVPSAYGVAVADYLSVPRIVSINTNGYQGIVGNTIVVSAMDDFRVASVRVILSNEGGLIIEQGLAVVDPMNALRWIYTTTQAHVPINGTNIRVIVSDRPGNEVEQTVQV